MMDAAKVLEFARARIDRERARFMLTAGPNVSVGGIFPYYVVDGTLTNQTLPPVISPQLSPLSVIMGEAGITIVPGVVIPGVGPVTSQDVESHNFIVPTVSGISVYARPVVERFFGGGFVWLRRNMTASVDNTLYPGAITLDFADQNIEVVGTQLDQPNPDTAYQATAFVGPSGSTGLNQYDIESVDPQGGFMHWMLCAYDVNGKILIYVTNGGTGNMLTPDDSGDPPAPFWASGTYQGLMDANAATANLTIGIITPAAPT